MSSLVDKEKSEELGQWAHNAYLEALAETEKTAQKLDQLAHDRAVKATEARNSAKSIYLAGTIVVCIWVVAIMFTWWIK